MPYPRDEWEQLAREIGGPDPADTLRLIEYLLDQGASREELVEAARTASLGTLALELALRVPGDALPFDEAAQQAGLELDEAASLWRALGFPDPLHSPTPLTPGQIQTLRVLAGMTRSLFGYETALQLARVLGGSVSQLAEAIVDSFRVNVEMPRRDQGEPYSEVVQDYTRTASIMLPELIAAIGDVLIGHLIAVSRSGWALDQERAAVTRALTVGFADLVDYTRSVRALTPAELAGAIGRFESSVGDVVTRYGGRVVKLIGDEVMFVIDDPGRAAQMASALMEKLHSDPQLPQVRMGLAAGPVVSRHGDYYGDVVNLASRLAKAAAPGTALLSESIVEHAPQELKLEALETPLLKGYDQPTWAYKLT